MPVNLRDELSMVRSTVVRASAMAFDQPIPGAMDISWPGWTGPQG
jgi:hypothetical protein